MRYKCVNCNRVCSFPLTKTVEGRAVMACPVCGQTELLEGDICPDCLRFYETRDLHGGFCLDCLRERIDYPTGLKYLLARKQLSAFLGTIDGEDADKADLHGLLMAFLVHEMNDSVFGRRNAFLLSLRDFITDDRVSALDFAKWLTEEEKAE